VTPQIASRMEQLLVEVPESDHGIEVVRAAPVMEGGYLVLSVPVFLYGLSRGTVIDAEPGPRGRLQFRRIRHVSPGATVRCYVSPATTARHVYEDHLGGPRAQRLGLRPVSLFDPDIVAVHVRDRRQLAAVGAYLDNLVLQGVLRFWEPADPGARKSDEGETGGQPWELVHPPAVDTDAPRRAT
jgi:Domain of unknown function (DUF4265)